MSKIVERWLRDCRFWGMDGHGNYSNMFFYIVCFVQLCFLLAIPQCQYSIDTVWGPARLCYMNIRYHMISLVYIPAISRPRRRLVFASSNSMASACHAAYQGDRPESEDVELFQILAPLRLQCIVLSIILYQWISDMMEIACLFILGTGGRHWWFPDPSQPTAERTQPGGLSD